MQFFAACEYFFSCREGGREEDGDGDGVRDTVAVSTKREIGEERLRGVHTRSEVSTRHQ